jgi:hypothetical protein
MPLRGHINKDLTMTTIIKTTKTSPLTGTAGGRPVRFSSVSYCWYYCDTQAARPAEKVGGRVVVVTK